MWFTIPTGFRKSTQTIRRECRVPRSAGLPSNKSDVERRPSTAGGSPGSETEHRYVSFCDSGCILAALAYFHPQLRALEQCLEQSLSTRVHARRQRRRPHPAFLFLIAGQRRAPQRAWSRARVSTGSVRVRRVSPCIAAAAKPACKRQLGSPCRNSSSTAKGISATVRGVSRFWLGVALGLCGLGCAAGGRLRSGACRLLLRLV
jgi:hypothetical protein